MTEKADGKSSIALETVLDWAYCEARVWWQTVGRSIEEKAEKLISPRTGSLLLQEAIQGILKLGHNNHQKGQDFEFPVLLGTLWKVRLKKWGLSHLREKMAAYSVLYEDLLIRFGEEGDIWKTDKALYDNPFWSYRWRDLATSMGLSDLRIEIDAEQHKAGLGRKTETSKTDMWKEPIGLADAFAQSSWIIKRNKFPLEDIEGVGEEVFISLPHIKIGVTPDLILRSDNTFIYEKHLYGIRKPKMKNLMNDYAIKALFSARQEGSEKEVESVFVRHLMSGENIRLKSRKAAGINEIESMATAVQRRLNAKDFSGPRMVNGWDACGSCDYKPLCFDGEGIMQRYNLPLSGRVSLADEMIEEMRKSLKKYTEEERAFGVEFARIFLPWVAQNPGMTAKQIDWLLSGD